MGRRSPRAVRRTPVALVSLRRATGPDRQSDSTARAEVVGLGLFAGDSVAVAVQTGSVAWLAAVERRFPGRADRGAVGVIDPVARGTRRWGAGRRRLGRSRLNLGRRPAFGRYALPGEGAQDPLVRRRRRASGRLQLARSRVPNETIRP